MRDVDGGAAIRSRDDIETREVEVEPPRLQSVWIVVPPITRAAVAQSWSCDFERTGGFPLHFNGRASETPEGSWQDGTTCEGGMRVELSKALSILSHEVRGSLGVLQGYLRMLRDGVDDPALTARMLQSMQDAATRLATVAGEASELSAWTEGRRAEGHESVAIGQLLEQAVAAAGVKDASVIVPTDHVGALVTSDPPGALARALSTVLVASRRESATAAFTLDCRTGSRRRRDCHPNRPGCRPGPHRERSKRRSTSAAEEWDCRSCSHRTYSTPTAHV